MLNSVKSRAEAQFAATQKKDKPALKEKDKARQERAEHVASLRALRLAKSKPIGIEDVKPAVDLVRIVLGGDENSAPVATYLAAEDQFRLNVLALP